MTLQIFHRPRAPHARHRGFTIIELMVTIAVAAILLAIAAPAMQNLISQRAVIAQSSELVEAMKFARSEAMKRSSPVTICKVDTPNSNTCSTTTSTTWQYWFVFAEQLGGSNKIGTFDAGEIPLRSQSSGSNNLTWQPASPSQLSYVTFQSTGIAVPSVAGWGGSTSGGAGAGSITIQPKMTGSADTQKRYVRIVCLNAQGRVEAVDGTRTCP